MLMRAWCSMFHRTHRVYLSRTPFCVLCDLLVMR